MHCLLLVNRYGLCMLRRQRLCFVCRNHNHRVCSTHGAGISYPFGAPVFTPCFQLVSCCSIFNFSVQCLVDSCLSFVLDYCIVCPSILASDYIFDIFKLVQFMWSYICQYNQVFVSSDISLEPFINVQYATFENIQGTRLLCILRYRPLVLKMTIVNI